MSDSDRSSVLMVSSHLVSIRLVPSSALEVAFSFSTHLLSLTCKCPLFLKQKAFTYSLHQSTNILSSSMLHFYSLSFNLVCIFFHASSCIHVPHKDISNSSIFI
eukprot:c40967_g1_i1 orf=473-784(+)